jgi:hypothetical protein
MRNRKAFMSAGGLFMLLVVMLGLVAVVNGLWSKNLVVEGIVETGDLNADWDCGYTNDDGLDGIDGVVQGGGCVDVSEDSGDVGLDPNRHDWPGFTDYDPFVRKDVGECHLRIGGDPWGNQQALVTIENAYPSYECTVTLYLTNTGSIPFNLISANLVLPSNALGVIETVDAQGVDLCDPAALLDDPQVDPGEELPFDCTVHVGQTAEQSDCIGKTAYVPWPVVDHSCDPATLVSYEFAIDVCVAQWNEAATATECKNSAQHEGPGTSSCGFAGVVDICVDGDGIASVGPGTFSINVGDTILSASALGNPAGLDLIERSAVDGVYAAGDDLMVEDPTGTPSCPTASRDAIYNNNADAQDCIVLDPDGTLADGDNVTCDTGAGCGLWFKDDNGNGRYDVGEDLVVDVNNNGIFD